MNRPSEPGGLLSKMVRFVKNPTTHWADLDQPASEEGDSESRLALKEMIERKRRNDFVRSREFDMLRKLRRRETLKDSDLAAGGPSFYPSSQPANTGERERTLKKINEIEAQMSTAWFKLRPGPGQSPAEPGSADAAAPSAHAYDKTDPMPLPSAGLRPMDAPPGFAPTVTMDPMSAPAPVAAPARAAGTGFGGPMLGEVPEFNVEVMAAGRHDPELEEAAILFANGDAAGAEALLLALLAEGGSRRQDLDTWLTLFDLYRCTGDQAKFDDIAPAFAALFGRSAPQWAGLLEQVPTPAPFASAPMPGGGGAFHWSSPGAIGMQSVAALRVSLERQAPPWRVDWRALKTIEPSALPALIELLQRWAETPVRLKTLDVERLLQVLTEHSPTGDRGADPQWWEARLALLRVLGRMDDFDLVALNYCVTYEVSPPAWEEPSNSWSSMTDDGETLMPSQFGAEEPGMLLSPMVTDHEPPADEPGEGVVATALEGTYTGSFGAVLQPLGQQGDARAFEFNCRQLVRVDFGAAGDMLNWATHQQGGGKAVRFQQVNRLVAAFFGVIGITDVARVLLRTD
ncbi:MAG TPA: hypothetical protein PLY54_01100 [Ottowia sp.]|nr:hypothetical protein [Ottowia sp.]